MNTVDSERIWFAGNLYLGKETYNNHENEFKFLEAWGNCVKKDDYICILGDLLHTPIQRDAEPKYPRGFWLGQITAMPGNKILLLGASDRSRPNWYNKFGFGLVVPLDDSVLIKHSLGNILISYLPAFDSVLAPYNSSNNFLRISKKHGRLFDTSSSILNIHAYTEGSVTNGKTVEVSLSNINYIPVLLSQIVDQFKNGLIDLSDNQQTGC